MTLSERNPYEVHAELVERLEHLEVAVVLLARHVGGVGWYPELRRALEPIEERVGRKARS
jgi:hypothetical protein